MLSLLRPRLITHSFAKSLLAMVFFCQFVAAQALLCVQFYTGETRFPQRNQLPNAIQDAFDIVRKDWVEEAHIPGVRESIEADSYSSLNRVNLFKELGFEWSADGHVRVPDTYEFLVRYHKAVLSEGYGHKRYIRPALVFVKYRDQTQNEILEYKLVDPFAKPSVQVPADFVPLERSSETFNLPYAVIVSGLKEGVFPLLGGLHDVAHYLGLRAQPDIGVAIVEAINRLPNEKRSVHFGRRLIALMEYSAFIPEKFRASLSSYLQPLGIKNVVSRTQIEEQLMNLSMPELLTRAKRSAEVLDKSLVDFGGATTSSWDRIGDTDRMFKKKHFSYWLAYHQVMFREKDQRIEDGLIAQLETRFREDRYEQIIRAYPRFFSDVAKVLADNLAEHKKEDFGWAFDRISTRSLGLIQHKEKMMLIRGKMEPRTIPELTPAGELFVKRMVAQLTSAVELQLAMAAYGMTPAEMTRSLLQPTLKESDALGSYYKQLYPGFIDMLNFLDKN